MTRKKQKNKKKIILLLLAVLLIAGVGGYFAMSLFNNKESKEEISEYEEQEEKSNDYDDSVINGNSEEDVVVEGKEIKKYEGENANSSESLTGVVTYAAVNGDKLVIRVSIDQYLSHGTCGLTLSRGGATVYSSIANIIGNASTSTCEGFDVPVSELGGGAMEININLNDGERQGVIRGEVNI